MYLLWVIKEKKQSAYALSINTCEYTTAKPYARLIDLNSPPYPLTDTNESDAPVTKRRTDVIL